MNINICKVCGAMNFVEDWPVICGGLYCDCNNRFYEGTAWKSFWIPDGILVVMGEKEIKHDSQNVQEMWV